MTPPQVAISAALDHGPHLITVKPDLLFPESVHSHGITHSEYPGLTFDVNATWDTTTLAYALVSLTVRSNSDITSPELRSLSRRDILSAALSLAEQIELSDGSVTTLHWTRELVSTLKKAGPTPETLRWMSRHYASARARGNAPYKAVMELFELEERTASRWIAKARTLELLD